MTEFQNRTHVEDTNMNPLEHLKPISEGLGDTLSEVEQRRAKEFLENFVYIF